MRYPRSKTNAVVFSLAAIIVILLSSFWLYRLSGVSGLLAWNKDYKAIFIGFACLSGLPLILLLLCLIFRSRALNRAATFLSCCLIIICIAGFGALYLIDHSGSHADSLNLIKASETLPIRDGRLHVAFSGDPHWGAGASSTEARAKILDAMAQEDYDLVFMLGDISEIGTVKSNYDEAVSELSQRLGDQKLRVIAGNHDAIAGALPLFSDIFMEDESFFYCMDAGTVHFIVLNVLWDEKDFKSDQKAWLEKTLASIDRKDTVIVLSHSYVLGSGYWDEAAGRYWGDVPGLVEALCPIFEAYDVDLHIGAHNHFMELCQKAGVDYATVGTMGGKLDENLVYESPYSTWKDNAHFGWLDVTIEKGSISLEFIDEDGNVLKSHSIKAD
jgi:hypothetical protein